MKGRRLAGARQQWVMVPVQRRAWACWRCSSARFHLRKRSRAVRLRRLPLSLAEILEDRALRLLQLRLVHLGLVVLPARVLLLRCVLSGASEQTMQHQSTRPRA